MAGMLAKLYHNPPSVWVGALKKRLGGGGNSTASAATAGETGASAAPTRGPAANPVTDAPLAAILDEAYFARRNPFIQSLIERARNREAFGRVMSGFDARLFDERVVEYVFLARWLLEQDAGSEILDVGCVLNNNLVVNLLYERCGSVWLCNPALERQIPLRNPVFYHLSDLTDAFPDRKKFPLVTCLSTIEHIGYDNSQYGLKKPGKYVVPQTATLTMAIRKLAELTAPGGQLLISVPFGYREALLHPVTGKIASQVFDSASIEDGLETLRVMGINPKLQVFQAQGNGWKPVAREKCVARYADGCPAAGAVAFITGTKAKPRGAAAGKTRKTAPAKGGRKIGSGGKNAAPRKAAPKSLRASRSGVRSRKSVARSSGGPSVKGAAPHREDGRVANKLFGSLAYSALAAVLRGVRAAAKAPKAAASASAYPGDGGRRILHGRWRLGIR